MGRKNGWQLAEHAGEATRMGCSGSHPPPTGTPDLARDDLRSYVACTLGDAVGMLVVDEIGFLKKGTTSVGCSLSTRHRRKVGNRQLGGVLGLRSSGGRAFIDRELYLPKAWTQDRAQCRAARVPDQAGFRTKPQLARVTLGRALDAGVRSVTGRPTPPLGVAAPVPDPG